MSLDEEFEIVTVANGARSLRSRGNGEVFHPVVGPMEEARSLHAAQQRLGERAAAMNGERLVVWDVGLGAAANALAVLEAARGVEADIELHSFDRTAAPLQFAIRHAEELGYLRGFEKPLGELLDCGVASVQGVRWRLHLGDFFELLDRAEVPGPHSVLFDPYSPAANPELWTAETFQGIRRRVPENSDCVLTSYSRSTAARTTMLVAGWWVGRGCATGEKSETTVAATSSRWLEAPLDEPWLQRLRRSTAPAPWRRGGSLSPENGVAISRELACSHPQFR